MKAQAEAAAGLLEEAETLSKFKELLELPGALSADVEECAKRIDRREGAAPVADMRGMTADLTDDALDIVAKASLAGDPETRQAALRALLVFVPPEKAKDVAGETAQ